MPNADIQDLWAAHGERLDRLLAIDERRLRESLLRSVRRALTPYAAARLLEVTAALLLLSVTLRVAGAHRGDGLYIGVTLTLAVYVIGALAFSARLLLSALRVDYGKPVLELQSTIVRMQRVEFRALEWALPGGVLVWLPAALIVFESVSGIPALARAPRPWLAANLLLGVAVILVARWGSRRLRHAANGSRTARRLADALSGRGLRRAAAHLEELTRFSTPTDRSSERF